MKNAVCIAVKSIGNRKGQGMVEYALIIGLIAICIVSLLSLIPGPIARIFASVAESLRITP